MIVCILCGDAGYEGTKLCDRCWELEYRILRNPILTRKILAKIDLEEESKMKKFFGKGSGARVSIDEEYEMYRIDWLQEGTWPQEFYSILCVLESLQGRGVDVDMDKLRDLEYEMRSMIRNRGGSK